MKRIFTLIAITIALGFSSVSSVFASLTVTINNRTQAQINISDPVAVCAGSDAFFFWGVVNNPPVLPVTYPNPTWTGTASAFISDPNTQFISFNCPTPGTYYLTFSAIENGITYSVTQPIVVYSKDPLSLDFPTVSPYSSCEGSSVSLEASGTLYYYWERTTDAQAIGSDPTVEETPPGIGTWTYRVYGYNEGCPTNPEFIEFEIDVEEAATVDAGGPYEVCSGSSVQLNGSYGGSATSIEWIGGLGSFNPDRFTTNAFYTPHPTESGTVVNLLLRTDDPAGVCPAVEDAAAITVHNLPSGSITSQVNVSCFGGNDGEVTVEGSGDGAPYQYSLDGAPFQVSGTFSGLTAGGYIVTVLNSNSCTFDVPVTITQPAAALTGSITNQVNVSCFGGNDGEVTVAGADGTGPYEYSLDGGPFQSSGTFSSLSAGGYTVTVRDFNLCTFDVPVTITQPATSVDGSITSQTNVLCFGNSTGEVTVAGADGTPPYQYSINGVDFQALGTFSSLAAGNYTVTVRDNNLCTFDVPVTITQPAAPLTGSITGQVNVSCFGGNDGEVTVAGADGTGPYEYSLDGGAYQALGTFSSLSAGGYIVTVRDFNLCTFDVPVTITQPAAALTGSITNQVNVFCFGGSDGEVTVAGADGTAPYEYSLDGGAYQALGTFSGLSAGGYIVTVRDFNLCTFDVPVTITQPAASLSGSITSQVNVSCFGGNDGEVTVAGADGTGPYEYSLDGGPFQSSGTFSSLSAGGYTVTVRDFNLCTFDVPVTITQPATSVDGSITSQTNVLCFGNSTGEVTVAGADGTPPYQYSINGVDFQALGTFSSLAAGNYTVTVRDNNLCTFDVPVTITQPAAPLTGSITGQVNVSCFGGNDGEVTVAGADGTGPYEYSLDGGAYQVLGTFSSLSAGGYIVTVRDFNLCTFDVPVTITQPAAALTGSITNQVNVFCFGGSDGEVTVAGADGTAPYEYSLDGGAYQALGTFSGLSAGGYIVTVRDFNLCTFDVPVTITQPAAALSGSITSQSNVNCSDSNDGEVTVEGSNGTAPYEYSINTIDFQVSGTFGGLAPGNYTITVRDANLCTFDVPVTITSPTPILIDYYTVTSIVDLGGCFGDNTGSIEVLASGGTPNYVYSLYNGASLVDTQTPIHPAPATFSNLVASNEYRIEVTDANGCTPAVESDIILSQPDQLIVNQVDVTNALCFGETNGTITITASGGTGSYVYSIFDETGPYDPSNVLNVTSGFYFIWVMDDNGCTAEYTGNPVFVDEPQKINFDYTVNNITTCFGATDGSIVINDVSGGSGNYEYSILEPAVWGTNPVFENLPGGPTIDYYIRVRDDSGCIVTGNNGNPITLDQPAEITFSTLPTNVTGCWYNTNGSIRVSNVIGGTGTKWVSINDTDVWYQIFNASTVRNFTNLGVGDHTIRVRDRNNGPTACEVTRVITLTGPPAIVISSLNLTHNLCFGDANGIIDATATGGTGSLNYSLLLNGLPYDGPQATGLFENLVAGEYTLEVRDDNSCVLSTDITITSPDELLVETDITNISCSFSGNDGIISARASGGTAPYTILLYQGGIEQANFAGVLEGDWVDFTGLAGASDYEVIVRDVNHPTCSEATSGLLTVVVPDVLEVNTLSVTSTDLTCNGIPTGTITIAGQGGILPYTYTLFDDLSNQVGDPIVANNTDPIQFIDLAAGTYTVAIDDANSCGPVNSDPITINEPAAIVIDPITVLVTNISCFGASDGEIALSASGGTGDLYYTITQGGLPVVGFVTQTNNGTFSPLEPGTYVIEITDDNACGPILSEELTVVEPEALDISTVVTDALCNGDNGSFEALASNGTPPYAYDLEDALGNPVETQNGDVDEWRTFINLAPGDYTLYVTDFNGCNNSTIVTIGEPEVVGVSITFFDHPTCDAGGNSTPGIITAEATGGSGTYVYSIYRNGVYQSDNTTGIFDALSSGDYYVEVYDSNGCGPATTATVTLNSPTDIEIDVINITNILCNGDLTGELEVLVINANGTPLYTITPGDDDWQTDNTFTNLAAGDYTVRVKDDNNCIISQLVTITQPALLEFSTVLTPPTTAVDTDGSIQVDVTGGTPNYWYELYIWDEGTVAWVLVDNADDLASTTHTFSGLGIGFYRIIVTDANGCSTFFDTPLSQFNITLSATDALCFESCDGTITVTPIGGAIQTIAWEKDGVDFTAEMLANYDPINEVYNNICAGLYTAYATDTEGNNATSFIEVFEPTAITVDYLVDTPDCFTNLPEALVVFDILGGTPFVDGYDITWDGGSARGFVAQDLAEGTYNFIISDANGCQFAVEEIEIVYPEGTTLSSLFVYDLTCNEDNSGGISMLVTGGTEPITYEIDGPSGLQQNNDGIFTGLEAGDYLLSITDANGCAHIFEEPNTVQVAQPTAIEIDQITSTIDPLNCHYDILSILGMEVTGGTPDYTYSWDNGQETVHLFDVSPGDYTLTVTDANGCQAVETVNVPGPDPLELTFTIDIAKCRLAPEGNTGQISITNLTGGTGVFTSGFNLEWFSEGMGNIDRDNSWTIDQLQAGTYYAVITDQNSCEDIIYFEVPYDEDNAFTVGIDMEDNYCFRDEAALTAIPIQGSFGSPAEFEWYNVTNDPDLIVGTSQNYNTPELTGDTRMLVRVISDMGCLEQRESTINVYPQIGPFLDRDEHAFFSDADTVAFRIDVGGGITIGDTTVISVLADTEYPVEVLTKNADYTLTYLWNPSEFFNPFNEKNSTMIFQSGTYEPYFTGQMLNTLTQKNEQYIPLIASVQSEFGCIETINLKARILDKVNTSNVFSPNGDGINDIWGIPYSDLFPDLEIKVFNRWGAQVWSAKGSEASEGWNGKNKNGKELPVGTYYYVINFNVNNTSKWKPVSGSVTIVR